MSVLFLFIYNRIIICYDYLTLMGKLFKIRRANRFHPFDVPAPYGFLVKKTEKGEWASICYDENAGINKREIEPDLEEYSFLEPNSVVLQLEESVIGKDLECFSKTVKGKYVPDGNYIPCLLNERLLLIKAEFLKPI